MKSRLLGAAGLLAASVATVMPLRSQTATSVAAPAVAVGLDVTSVQSGGRWEARGRSGYLRVIESAEGWEEVRHHVFVQWIEEPAERRQPTIRATLEVGSVLADAWSLTAPQLVQRGESWFVQVHVADAPMAQPRRTATVRIGPPGTLTVVANP